MSADNWTTCPRCKRLAAQAQAEAAMKATEAYGKVSLAQYAQLQMNIAGAGKFDRDTLREDYEIGVDDDGTFEVSYSCSCQRCDFEFSYKYEADAIMRTPI